MYCLIQLYVCVSSFLASQKPLLKMFAIKAVGKNIRHSIKFSLSLTNGFIVFLTFWQATFLSLLATFGFIKDVSDTILLTWLLPSDKPSQTQYMTAENINIGIGAIAETVEMTCVLRVLSSR